jgi:hypothetical protein
MAEQYRIGRFAVVPSVFKAVTSGFVGAGATYAINNQSGYVTMLGKLMSPPVAVGVGCGVASLGTDLISPYTSHLAPGWSDTAVGTVASGILTAGVMCTVPQSRPSGCFTTGIIGAGSYAVADTVTHSVFGNPTADSMSLW